MAALQHESEIKAAIRRILARRDEVGQFQDAAAGRYEISVGSMRFKEQMRRNFNRLADNLVPRVLAAVSDRLIINGIDPYTPDDQLHERIKQQMRDLRMDAFSKRVHHAALRDGSAFVVLTRDLAGKPALHLNTADCFEVARDDENQDRILCGVKVWTDSAKRQRITIFYSDRIERYVLPSNAASLESAPILGGELDLNGLQPFDEDGGASVVPHEFGSVPVAAFLNQPDERLEGVSELVSVLPIQQALNASLINLLAAAEAWAVPTRYICGLLSEYDDNGDIVKPEPSAGGTWIFGDESIKIGQLPGADLHQSIAAINDLRHEIARVSGVPIHMLQLTTSYPSGEALKVAEASLVGKIRDRQVVFGNAWEDIYSLLIDTGGNHLSTRWSAAEMISDLDRWQSAILQRNAGVSARQILRERGYSIPQIEQIISEREDEDVKQREMQQMLFNVGADTYNPDLG